MITLVSTTTGLVRKLRKKWAQLAQERQTRWATDSHHCVVCGVPFGPNPHLHDCDGRR